MQPFIIFPCAHLYLAMQSSWVAFQMNIWLSKQAAAKCSKPVKKQPL